MRETTDILISGGGVAGLTAAYLLQRAYDVTLYEADDRLGGHAHSHDIAADDVGRRIYGLSILPDKRLGMTLVPNRTILMHRALAWGFTLAGVIGITIYVGKKTSGEVSEFGSHRSLWRI